MVEPGLLVVCDGGGGIPVIEDHHGHQRGAYAVIDKDLASALLAGDLGVETLVLATDVEAVYEGYGTPAQRPITMADDIDHLISGRAGTQVLPDGAELTYEQRKAGQ